MTTYRVMLAGNDAARRAELRNIVETAGHTIVGETTPETMPVAAGDEAQSDVVLLDARPGFEGGSAALEALRQWCPTPVVLVTDAREDQIIENAAANGAFALLLAPFEREEVLGALSVAVHRFRDWSDCQDSLRDLQSKLEDRKVIERAKGFLMRTQGLTEEDAFKQIHYAARQQNRKMREIADNILLETAASSS